MNPDQFELQPYTEELPKRKTRGPNKNGTFVYVGIRIEKETLAFYNQFKNRQAAIREVLKDYMEQIKKEMTNAS